jgi:hypothetical protein
MQEAGMVVPSGTYSMIADRLRSVKSNQLSYSKKTLARLGTRQQSQKPHPCKKQRRKDGPPKISLKA